jgi:nucleoid-associated protein EbfC
MEPEVDEMMERLARQQEQLDRIRRDVDAMVVKGRSRANEVEVSVRGTGRVTGIAIDPAAIRRYDAHDLGVIVAEAVNAALDNLSTVAKSKFAPALA